MSRPKNLQELVHWLELGQGARWVRLTAVVLAGLLLSLFVGWKQFRGATSESTLLQADIGRQVAQGHGFTTLVNYPQTAAVLAARGIGFEASTPYPELYHAPLYAIAVAGTLRLLPSGYREALFDRAPVPPDGFGGDYLLLALNLALLWLAATLTFSLGRRLFDARTAWLAVGGLLLSVGVWQATTAVNGTPLLMALALATFSAWHRAEQAMEPEQSTTPRGADGWGRSARRHGWLAAVGLGCGALFLTEYTAGALVVVAFGSVAFRLRGRARTVSLCWLAAGFLLVAGPWMARNVRLTGSPVALAIQNVALKSGDPTADPAIWRNTLSADAPKLNIQKLGNKTLTRLQESARSTVWSGGALWFLAFFVVGWLYPFRNAAANRLRWSFTAGAGVLIVAQAALNSGASERWATTWLVPLVMVFGGGFFFVLVGSSARLARRPWLCAAVLLGAQAIPLLHEALEPRRLHFHYPPYFPSLFAGLRQELERRDAQSRFGVMADVPAGVAWYGRQRVWSQPAMLRDFYAITLEQPIGELLLSPRTLDRPFFSDLLADAKSSASSSGSSQRLGEWSQVYAGLFTGTLPAEFPLRSPQRVAENLFILLNPALPPVREK